MWLSQLRFQVRAARRQAGYTVINVAGLGVGMACVILIALFVRFELTFDQFHTNADRIYRVQMEYSLRDGRINQWLSIPLPMAGELKAGAPAVEEAIHVFSMVSPVIKVGNDSFSDTGFLRSEPAFFDVFDFPILEGSAEDLARPGTVIISESTARRAFGERNPVGELLAVADKYEAAAVEYEVVGIMKDMPANTHLQARYVASVANESMDNWRRISYTYVLLRPGADRADLEASFAGLEAGPLTKGFSDQATLLARSLADIHLRPDGEDRLGNPGDFRYVYLFAAIGLIILIIAGINYVNLATARASRRMAEIGVRKAVGASRGQLMGQFLAESLFLTVVAMILAVGLAEMAIESFGAVLDRTIELDVTEGLTAFFLLGLTGLLGLLAGWFPALVLARTSPVSALRGGMPSRSRSLVRQGLVVFQFAASIALVVGTVVIHQQMQYVQHARLGFAADQTLVLRTRGALGAQGPAFKQRLAAAPGISLVGGGSAVPGEPTAISFFSDGEIEGYSPPENDVLVFQHIMADASFLETLGVELVEGRLFDADRAGESGSSLIVNQSAVERLGWESALGKTFTFNDGPRMVIGVIADIHMEAMREKVEPLIIELQPDASQYFAINLETTDVAGTLSSVREAWDVFLPDLPFSFSFLDDDVAAMYRAEQNLGRLIGGFSVVAILIACLGLFGLATYASERRTKEIGIRKVLGASVSGLVGLLSMEFAVLVAIAFMVAAPLAFRVMSSWLDSFAYRTAIGWEVFAVAAGVTLLLALGTVSAQALRAALSNPVDSLRSE